MNVVKPETVSTTGSITRSTVGTYFDSTGTMQTAAINAARVNYDPITKEFLGVLLEDASTNLLTYSQDFDNAAWTKTRSTVIANAASSPDGTTNAEKLVEDTTASNNHYISNSAGTLTANTVYTLSVYAKAAGRTKFCIQTGNVSNWANQSYIGFDLTTGTTWSIFGFPTTGATITYVGNGWYRCSVTQTFGPVNGLGSINILLADSSTTLYNGNGTSGIFIYGAQIEATATPTSYIKTTTTAANRAADVITGSGLVYTTLTEYYSEWSSATTYALGALVVFGTYGTYQSLQSGNLNHTPPTTGTFTDAYWIKTGPTNKMAIFDDLISSSSTASTDIVFAVVANSVDTVALLNVVGSKTNIAVTDTSLKTVVYHNAQQLTGGESLDWYSYFFYDSDTQRTLSLYMDIPVVSNGLITIKVSGSGTISIGSYIMGLMKDLGGTQYGASAGIIDYSRKDADEFGNVSFVKRSYSKRINATISLTNANLNRVQRILYQLRATPVLWVASTDIQFEEPLITYGFYKDFSTEISYPTHSICNLQIEGLI